MISANVISFCLYLGRVIPLARCWLEIDRLPVFLWFMKAGLGYRRVCIRECWAGHN